MKAWQVPTMLALGMLLLASGLGPVATGEPAAPRGARAASSDAREIWQIEMEGQYGGSVLALWAEAERVYLGAGPRLLILDASDPAEPVELGRSAVLAGAVLDIQVAGETAYVAMGEAGVAALDVGDPAAIRLLWQQALPGSAVDLDVADGRIAVAARADGLQLLELSPHTGRPLRRRSWTEPGFDASKVRLAGEQAYLAGWSGDLWVLSLAREEGIEALARHRVEESLTDFDLNATHLYVTTSEGRLITFERHTAGGLREVAGLTAPDTGYDAEFRAWFDAIQVVGEVAYVASIDGYLLTVDLREPASPRLAGMLTDDLLFMTNGGLFVTGDRGYLQEAGGFLVVDLSEPFGPCQIGRLRPETDYVDPSGWRRPGRAVAGQGGYGFVAAGQQGLWVIDGRDPSRPVMAGRHEGHELAMVAVEDRTLVALGWYDRLIVYDVTEPPRPRELGSLQLEILAIDVALAQGLALVVGRDGELLVVDLRDPSSPRLLTEVELGAGEARNVEARGDRAYLVVDAGRGTEELIALDLGRPESPQVLGVIALGKWMGALAVDGDRAYLLGEGDLWVVEIADPANMAIAGRAAVFEDMEEPHRLVVRSGRAFVLGYYGVGVMDVSDPARPRQLGRLLYYDTELADLALVGDHVHTLGEDGLRVLDMSRPTRGPRLIADAPATGWPRAVPYLREFEGRLYMRPFSGGSITEIELGQQGEPHFVRYRYLMANIRDWSIARGRATILDYASLSIWDLEAEPPQERLGQAPQLGRVTVDRSLGTLVVDGTTAYLAGASGQEAYRLQIVDLADASQPTLGGTLARPRAAPRPDQSYGYTTALAVEEGTVILVYGDVMASGSEAGLVVIDVRDPSAPWERASMALPGQPRAIALAEGHAFVSAGEAGLLVVDLRDPSALRMVATDPGQATSALLRDGHAFVLEGSAGLRMLSVADPAQPLSLARASLPGYAAGTSEIVFRDGRILFGGGSLGLLVLRPTQRSEVGRVLLPVLAR